MPDLRERFEAPAGGPPPHSGHYQRPLNNSTTETSDMPDPVITPLREDQPMHDGDYWLEVFEPDGVSISWVEPFLTKEAAINVLLHSQLPARVTLDGETIASTGVIRSPQRRDTHKP